MEELIVQPYDADGTEWDAFVAASVEGTNYHRYGWRRVIEESFGHRAHYLTARNRAGEIRGVLPLVHMKSLLFGNFLVSLPFVNYGGLLCADEAAATPLLEGSRQLLGQVGAQHAELRHLRSREGLSGKRHKVTMLLSLQKSEKAQWDVLDPKVRNQVRKAEKSGLTARAGHLELLDGFYDVFCRNMRDLGTPVYSKTFFRAVLTTFPESTRIISILLDGEVIASAILTWYRDTLEVPWASSVRDYRALCPNNLLYWEAIKYAIERGAAIFDFGRSTPGEGTFHFKKHWGAEPQQLYWDYLLRQGGTIPELSPSNPKYRLAISVWQRLPVGITKLIGPPLVRNIP